MKSVAIVGGGITGLTAAFRLRRNGIPVTLYEASERVGGVIQSLQRDGYLAEFGPNTILETSPKVASLVEDLGLAERRLYSDPAANNRYLVRDGRVIKMPESPLGFIMTPLFSPAAKLRLLLEPFIAPSDPACEESVAGFVTRRLGREFLDHAIDALVGGIYAGDPEKLSVPQAFPKLHALEQKYGSLIKGQILGARERKKSAEVAKPNAKKLSFDEGLQVLPDTLCAQLADSIRLGAPVNKVTQREQDWVVNSAAQPNGAEHSAVVYAAPAFGLGQMEMATRRPLRVSSLAEIHYPPVASVVLGFKRKDVEHPLDGFGMLIPRVEGFNILGTIFSSSLFPGRAPKGCVTLTSYLGGDRAPELAQKSREELFAMTRQDLRRLLGVLGQPTFQHHMLYPRAIPQYQLGYARFKEAMGAAETDAPGLFFAGHYRDGISVSDCIVSGHEVAERVANYFKSNQASPGARAASTPVEVKT
jgi:protoporphyrinogen/coproporphyrinogen III oxidase